MIFFGEASLRRALREFMAHYHHERTHRGLGNTLIAANDESFAPTGAINQRVRLGGILNYYDRTAGWTGH